MNPDDPVWFGDLRDELSQARPMLVKLQRERDEARAEIERLRAFVRDSRDMVVIDRSARCEQAELEVDRLTTELNRLRALDVGYDLLDQLAEMGE